MTTERKPKLKMLPKVWVLADKNGSLCLSDGYSTRREEMERGAWDGDVLHQYAPVQKPRRCVWVFIDPYWMPSCDKEEATSTAHKYCPWCGGKIARSK